MASGLPAEAVIKTVSFSLARVEYDFWGERFSFSTPVCQEVDDRPFIRGFGVWAVQGIENDFEDSVNRLGCGGMVSGLSLVLRVHEWSPVVFPARF